MDPKVDRWSVDIPKFISAVKNRPILYNFTNPDYHDKLKRDAAWKEVATIIGITNVEFCRKRWKSIRDGFRTDYRMEMKYKYSNDPPWSDVSKKRKYIFYDDMTFLLPYLRKCRTNSQQPHPQVGHNDEEPFLEIHKEELDSRDSSISSGSSLSPNDEAEEPTNQVDDPFTNEESFEDEDKQFLLSLLPALKMVKNARKMVVKMNFMKLLQDELYPEGVAGVANSSSS